MSSADVPPGGPVPDADDTAADGISAPEAGTAVDALAVLAARRRARRDHTTTEWPWPAADPVAPAVADPVAETDTADTPPEADTDGPARESTAGDTTGTDAGAAVDGLVDGSAGEPAVGDGAAEHPPFPAAELEFDEPSAFENDTAVLDIRFEPSGAIARPEATPGLDTAAEPDAAAEPDTTAEPHTTVVSDTAAEPDATTTEPRAAVSGTAAPAADEKPKRPPVAAAPVATTDPTPGAARALSWLDSMGGLADAGDPLASHARPGTTPLLEHGSPRHSARIVPTLITAGIVIVVIIAYCTAALLWPLSALTPTVASAPLKPVSAPAAHLVWPQSGAAGVQVAGMGQPVASTTAQSSIASITKLVTALMVLDQLPLTLGQQGPAYTFTFADRVAYWGYLARNESSLNVPVDGSLTEYQMLEGMLMASASNYAARMAYDIWPTDQQFSEAATAWLAAHRISGITITDPTGFTTLNTATPAALLALSRLALKNPVIARIVAQKSVTLPGAGTIDNTNELLQDAGVVGVKTGTLVGYDLLAAKDVQVAGKTVRITAVGLNQPSSDQLWTSMRSLFSQTQKSLAPTVVVPAGTTVGTVTTAWGARATLTSTTDADAILWNGASATTTASLSLGAHRTKGQHAGTVTVTGPIDSTTVGVALSSTVAPPTAWWRLTHPLRLLGIG